MRRSRGHTGVDAGPTADPWLKLDLQQDIAVAYIVLYNRVSGWQGNQDRLGHYTISWATDAAPDSWIVCADQTAPATAGPFASACAHIARYIRLQLEGFNFLHFAQIEVFGTFGISKSLGRCGCVAPDGRCDCIAPGRCPTSTLSMSTAAGQAAAAASSCTSRRA